MRPIALDMHGTVIGFAYHDGFLDGLSSNEGGDSVHLALRSTSGNRRLLRLSGVTAFCMDEFRAGNIVLSIRVVPAPRAAANSDWCAQIAARLLVKPESVDSTLLAFRLDASYGANVLAICRNVEVSEDGGELVVSGVLPS